MYIKESTKFIPNRLEGAGFRAVISFDGVAMYFNEAEDVSTENVSEEKLWIKETLGSEAFAPGVKKLIINQQNQQVVVHFCGGNINCP